MHRIDTDGHDDGLFQDGTPQTGQQGTIMDAAWANGVQENIVRVILDAGIALVKGTHTQLRDAIAAMISAAAVDWTDTIDSARVPPGVIEMYGGGEAPTGYLECDGGAHSRADYAGLYAAIGTTFGVGDGATTFNVPDLRAEFPRGWDHGRGVDAARTLGSAQAESSPAWSLVSNALAGSGLRYDPEEDSSDNRLALSSGGEAVRPRNVALMFIIKT